MSVKVKICGITNTQDALWAEESGADAVGFIFAPSPRRIGLSTAQKISRALGPLTARVGVFVNAPAAFVRKAIRQVRLDAVQFHGDETPRYCKQFNDVRIIKAFRFEAEIRYSELNRYRFVDLFLIDTYDRLRGGTGKTWNWSRLQRNKIKKPLMISGGLKPSNAGLAARLTKPYALDVSGGVEIRPGKKSRSKVKGFIRNAKKARLS